MATKWPRVAIVGRPNVGKSTLFNRLLRRPAALVEDYPGVTRDRLYGTAEWLGITFTLIDTAGLLGMEEGEEAILAQVRLAIDEAEKVLFVVDVKDGLTPLDQELAIGLRRAGKNVVLAVNKAEGPNRRKLLSEFYALGLGEPLAVSAAHGQGIGELLDALVAGFDADQEVDPDPDEVIRLAIVGRPNVGKSTLLNRLLGEERVVVSPVPGTTRDAVDAALDYDDRHFVLVDTAGIRRRARVSDRLEEAMVRSSLNAVERADVVALVIDAQRGLADQEQKIAGYADARGRSMLIVVNKWDLIQKDEHTHAQWQEQLRQKLHFLSYAPLLFISAQTGQRVQRLLEEAARIAAFHRLRVATAALNAVVRDAVALRPPPTDKGRLLKIYYVTQVGRQPPEFVFFVNDRERVHFSYIRYLERVLRESFGFEGTPLRLSFRERTRSEQDA